MAAALPATLHAQTAPQAEQSARLISLEDARAQAIQRNETWQIVQTRIERSQAERRVALAGLLPLANVTAQGLRGPEVKLGDRVFQPAFNWNAQAALTVPLLDLPALATYWQSGELIAQQEHLASWQRQLLLLELEQAYFTLVSAQQEIEIAERTRDLREVYVERAEALVQAQVAVPIDVARAKTDLLQAEQAVVEARVAQANAGDALASLMGEQPGSSWKATVELREAPVYAQTQTRSLVQRADFAAQTSQLSSLDYAEDSQWYALIPQLDLGASARFGPATVSNPNGYIWSVSLSFSWALYDGGARYARAESIRAQQREIRLARDQSMRQASVEITRAEREWQAAGAQILLTEEQVGLAQQSLDLAKQRFEQGVASSLEINDANGALFTAEIAHNRAVLRAKLASIRVRYLKEAVDAKIQD
jgi:outer membrane protein TolC